MSRHPMIALEMLCDNRERRKELVVVAMIQMRHGLGNLLKQPKTLKTNFCLCLPSHRWHLFCHRQHFRRVDQLGLERDAVQSQHASDARQKRVFFKRNQLCCRERRQAVQKKCRCSLEIANLHQMKTLINLFDKREEKQKKKWNKNTKPSIGSCGPSRLPLPRGSATFRCSWR
jgi:hypothetical protein